MDLWWSYRPLFRFGQRNVIKFVYIVWESKTLYMLDLDISGYRLPTESALLLFYHINKYLSYCCNLLLCLALQCFGRAVDCNIHSCNLFVPQSFFTSWKQAHEMAYTCNLSKMAGNDKKQLDVDRYTYRYLEMARYG